MTPLLIRQEKKGGKEAKVSWEAGDFVKVVPYTAKRMQLLPAGNNWYFVADCVEGW